MRENETAANKRADTLVENAHPESAATARPCSKEWEAYRKALAEAVEARKQAQPYTTGQKTDSAGDWILTRAFEANQKAEDAFKAWRACILAHPLD